MRADLIYLDPPFNSSRIYSMIFNAHTINAQHKAFHDMWDFHKRTRQLLLDFEGYLEQSELPPLFRDFMTKWLRILEQGNSEDRKLLNYLMYMTERLIRMKKILKDTGSIYFHCDPTASHYIKIVMDGVFERKNFVNEIVWCYKSGGAGKRRWARKHDVILMFRKTKEMYFNPIKEKSYMLEYSGENPKQTYYKDKKGRYTRTYPKDWWEISILATSSKERRGYPTQKPPALLNKIIKASCPPDGIVLDPFCGCGTTIAAADKNKMSWIGIDISGDAVEEIQKRLLDVGVSSDAYTTIEGNPETMVEYNRMTPFEKQDWLIRRIHGVPNPVKSGDKGIDGDMQVHQGFDGERDHFQKVIFSVKTGKQADPKHVRELEGTIRQHKASFGVLILDKDPTPKMEEAAEKQGKIDYQENPDSLKVSFQRIQMMTAQEIIDGKIPDLPRTLQAVRQLREEQNQRQKSLLG